MVKHHKLFLWSHHYQQNPQFLLSKIKVNHQQLSIHAHRIEETQIYIFYKEPHHEEVKDP